jgi:hypothetical protein
MKLTQQIDPKHFNQQPTANDEQCRANNQQLTIAIKNQHPKLNN